MSTIQFSPRLWAAAGVSVAAAAASGAAVAAMADATLSSNYAAPQVFFTKLTPGETAASAPPVSVSVSQFDPSLGTLTGISLSFADGFDYGASASIPLAGCSDFSETGGSCSYSLTAALSMTGLMITPEGTGTAGQDLSVNDTTSRTNLLPGTRVNSPYGSGPATALVLPVGFGTDLLPYTGTGSWELLFSIGIDGVRAQSECTGIGSFSCYDESPQMGTASGDAVWSVYNLAVTYTYDPAAQVPEPSSLALFSVALLGVGAVGGWGRRRQA